MLVQMRACFERLPDVECGQQRKQTVISALWIHSYWMTADNLHIWENGWSCHTGVTLAHSVHWHAHYWCLPGLYCLSLLFASAQIWHPLVPRRHRQRGKLGSPLHKHSFCVVLHFRTYQQGFPDCRPPDTCDSLRKTLCNWLNHMLEQIAFSNPVQ